MKQKIITWLVLIVTTVILIFFYYGDYPVKNKKAELEKALGLWIMDPDLKFSQLNKDNLDTVELRAIEKIDNLTVAFLTYERDDNEIFAGARLRKGLNGRYKILGSSHSGGGSFLFQNLKTARGSYRVVMGKNFNKEIDSFSLTIDGQIYNANVSEEDYFIRVFKIPEKSGWFNELALYDAQNNDITEKIRKKYPVPDGGGSRSLMEEGVAQIKYWFITIIAGMIIYNQRKKPTSTGGKSDAH